jgi:hypothetical protein
MTIRKVGGYGAGLGANTFTGAQSAPSLALGGATIGSNALAVTGTVNTSDNLTIGGNFQLQTAGVITFGARSRVVDSADGVLALYSNAGTNFNRLQFGGTTSSFPSIKRNATALNFRLADDSADAPITAAAATFTGTLTGAAGSFTSLATSSINTLNSNSGAFSPLSFIDANTGGKTWTMGPGGGGTGAGNFGLYNTTNSNQVFTFSSTGALTLPASLALGGATIGSNALAVTGTAAISGAVSIGNTVNSVSPTSPNRTVTMVIGGTTYYLAAKTTND